MQQHPYDQRLHGWRAFLASRWNNCYYERARLLCGLLTRTTYMPIAE